MQSINQQLKKAIFQSVLGRYGAYAVQVITMMVYARWFTPEQFGILAAIQIFTTFFMMLAEVGLGPALINLKELDKRDKNGLFSLTIIIGILIGIGFYLCSYGLNNFFHRNDYQYISIPVCIAVFFYTINTLPNAFLQREKKFLLLARTDIFSELPTLFVVFYISKYDPLIALSSRVLSIALFRFILNYINSMKTEFGVPSVGCKLGAIRPLLGFSLYQFGFNFVNFFSRNLDNLLVGRYIGMSALGIYDKAYTLMKYPLQLLTFAMTPAIQPVISQHGNNIQIIKDTHDQLVIIMAILSVFAGGFVLINSHMIILILLGENWLSVTPLLELLSITIPVQIIMSTSGSFYQAVNRTDLLFMCGLFSACTNIMAISIGIYCKSLIILSTLLIISFTINFIQCYIVMYKYVYKSNICVFFQKLLTPVVVFIALILLKAILIKLHCGDIISISCTAIIAILFYFVFLNKIKRIIMVG